MSACMQTLNGDAVEEPPPYLKLLLSLGPKYVPPHQNFIKGTQM